MMVTKKLDAFGKKMDFGPKNCIFGPKFCIFLRYTYETPIFSARTVPTQWDHKSPISWGNSGYLRFSGRWPFGRLAGRFVAPIAQSGPFGVQKCCFWPKNIFDLVNGDFGHWRLQNGLPRGQTATYRKTEGIQSYLRIWGRYDPIKSGPFEPNKLETFEDALWKQEKLQHVKLKSLYTWLISMRKAECGTSQS